MDTDGKLSKVNNDKGFALVYLALVIVVLVAIVGLAVDVGYMYVTKGQLQNAADSAALAGAAGLKAATTDITAFGYHSSARRLAWRFACKNSAATKDVFLVSSANDCESPPADLNNSNSPTGDIVLGHWDAADSPPFTPADGVKKINAVKVLARRTEGSPGGQVDTFFARILGWNQLSAASDAIAAKQAAATEFIALCVDFCMTGPIVGERILVTGTNTEAPSSAPTNSLFAWSSITERPSGPGINLDDIICNAQPNVEACGKPIYTTMGGDTTTLRKFESVMYDPSFDSDNKTIVNGIVTGWTITVPVTTTCPPGSQGIGIGIDPHEVWGYAQIHLTAICTPGGGQACNGRGSYSAPQAVCNYYRQNGPQYAQNALMVIDGMSCVNCEDSSDLLGLTPALVK